MKNIISIFQKITKDLLEDEKNNPVADYIPSSELFEVLDLELKEEGMIEEDFYQVLRSIVFASPRTATKGFFNQLFGGRNDKAILGELLSVILNNSMYTYKAAGPQIGVEKSILKAVCKLIGWTDAAEGTLAPGGSMTNFMAMLMARDAATENARYKGMQVKLLVYTSKESHYSIPKNASFCGIGRDNVRYVPTDEEGRLDVSVLRQMVEQDIVSGAIPAMINLTAGTTVLGSFDPIRPVSALCKKYGIWLHIDGAYCGSVLFSKKHKHLIDGVELVDSFSFNAHKMLGTPLSCSIIVVQDKKYLYESFSNDASYLYQTDHDDFNLGKISLQCGRRNDALKFWTLWKSIGTCGLEKIVDHQFELANTAREYIRANENYTLYSYDDSISICFNYKGIPARTICTQLYEHSKLMVGYGCFGKDEFIRLVTINAQNQKQDILDFFNTLEDFVAQNATLSEAQTV
jgi:sulfinoalanine decarboxylase/sulfinoalanine decarboxylase/aspartate 1-decarboxylase